MSQLDLSMTVPLVAARSGGRPIPSALRLLRSEMGLTFRRPRNIAMLVVLAIVPVIVGVTLRIATSGDIGTGVIAQIAGNGLMLTFFAFFVMVPLVLPLAVSVVAGDAIAGEASLGTLRYLLAAPAGRTRLLSLKYANVVVFCLAACLLVAVSALVTGLVLFPVGPVTLLSGSTISMGEALLRIAVVALYAAAGMAALGAVALAISTLTEVPVGAISTSVVLVVVTQVLQTIPQLSVIRPYLLPVRWMEFIGAMRSPMDTGEMVAGLLTFAAYAAIAGAVAWSRFASRDVTS